MPMNEATPWSTDLGPVLMRDESQTARECSACGRRDRLISREDLARTSLIPAFPQLHFQRKSMKCAGQDRCLSYDLPEQDFLGGSPAIRRFCHTTFLQTVLVGWRGVLPLLHEPCKCPENQGVRDGIRGETKLERVKGIEPKDSALPARHRADANLHR
jgi:hypothetical protein